MSDPKDIGTEVNLVSGFSMDETSNENEPIITIENSSDRPVVSLNNDIDIINDIGVIMPDSNISEPPKPVIKEQRKRQDSFTSDSSGGSSYIEYKRSDSKKDKKSESKNDTVPFDFGDIADPAKHKVAEEVKFDDNGYSSAGDSSDSGSSGYSRNHKSSNSHSNSHSHNYSSSRDDYNYNRESEGDRYRREDEEKQEYLIKLQGLESKGVRLTREFSMKSRLDDIKFEYEKQKSLIEKDASVDFMKNMLITFVHGTEILNGKFDPVGAKLNGWSESVMENIGSYESIFEKLHEKYQGSVDVAPELELLMTLASSAFMFHMMQTLFKNAAPNLGTAVMQDPNLMAGLGQAAARAADMTNNQNQARNAGIPTPVNQNMSGPSQGFDISSLLSGMGPLMGMMGGAGGGQNPMAGLAGMMGGMGQQGASGLASQGRPSMVPPANNSVQHAFQNPPPRPVDPRTEPAVSGYNQQNFRRPRDDDENSRMTDFSDDSDGSAIRVSRSNKKSGSKRVIHLG